MLNQSSFYEVVCVSLPKSWSESLSEERFQNKAWKIQANSSRVKTTINEIFMSQRLAVWNTDEYVVSLHYLQYFCDQKNEKCKRPNAVRCGAAEMCRDNELLWSYSDSEVLFLFFENVNRGEERGG